MGSTAAKPPDHAADGHYVWSADGKPVSVHLSIGIVRRLEAQLSASETEPSGRAVEFGGLLLGRVRQASSDYWLVSVDSFEPVECEHVRGASWILSKSDKQALASSLRKYSKSRRDGLQPVGWFRTHTRPGLFLDQHDFELFQEFFPDPWAVALAVRPPGESSATAGFFFWEGEDVRRNTSYRTFPFRTDALAPLASRAPIPVSIRIDRPVPAPAVRRAAPAPKPSQPRDWKKLALWAPVAVGAAAAILWNPTPLERQQRNRSERVVSRDEAAPPRAVFPLPAPEPLVVAPVVETVHTAPPVRTPPKPRRELRVPTPRREGPRPQLIADLPSVPAATYSPSGGIPALKLEATPYLATATVEPARVGTLRRAVGSIPGLGFLKRKNKRADFVPARAIREVRPTSPADLGKDVPVRVKLHVSESGDVIAAELVGKRVDQELANLAVDAAKRWKFAPAKEADAPVETEVVVQFRFGPGGRDL